MAFAAAGGPVYAECGGLLYLAEALEDESGRLHPMVGLLPTIGRMVPKRLALGYAEVELTRGTPIGPAGTTRAAMSFTPRGSIRCRSGCRGRTRFE